MRFAIVDDSETDRDELSGILKDVCGNLKCTVKTDAFSSGDELLARFMPGLYTALFLDIWMSGKDGIETAQAVRRKDPEVKIIFVTDSSEHMPEAFDIHAFQYLRKSPDQAYLTEKITQIMTDILQRMPDQQDDIFRFTADRRDWSLSFDHILCLESSGHYTIITDESGRKYRIRMTFHEAEDCLHHDPRFLSINRGIIINMDHIVRFDKATCTLPHGITFPVKVRRQKDIDELRQNYIFSRLHSEMKDEGKSSEQD